MKLVLSLVKGFFHVPETLVSPQFAVDYLLGVSLLIRHNEIHFIKLVLLASKQGDKFQHARLVNILAAHRNVRVEIHHPLSGYRVINKHF